VRGVPSTKYPINEKCAHPECNEPTTVHHCFPRSQIGNGSYFVEIERETNRGEVVSEVIPHAVGLCGSGTTGHHGDVEEHRAWIRYEDGEFVWYDRDKDAPPNKLYNPPVDGEWTKLGPLNPQPGSREGKPKRKRFTGEARKQRKVLSIKVPSDAEENGAEIWDELLVQCREALGVDEDFPVYHTLCKVLYDWLTTYDRTQDV
jgi:hypothetical protein